MEGLHFTATYFNQQGGESPRAPCSADSRLRSGAGNRDAEQGDHLRVLSSFSILGRCITTDHPYLFDKMSYR